MISTQNLVNLLTVLGFSQESGSVFKKTFGDLFDSAITVDVKAQKITYPDALVVNDETTCNFSHPENFVVLECVSRLLSKGYRAEHIELEKRWNLGHEAKGGKADICVYDGTAQRNMLLIIECKTFGAEYAKEKKNLLTDGGQLFSYWQQERHTKWLALYASDLKGEEIVYENDIINCADDNNLVLIAEKDDTIKLFKNAGTVEEKFTVWSETYNKALYHGLIFGADAIAYQIGVKPLRKKDLRDFTPDDKIVNRFEEILRHNNVSDKENAFNRLIALFICKLVDEIGKDDDAELEFQYKQGIDTYETLQDRLQKLHQQGMNDFMREKIFYVPNDYAEKLVQQYSGQKRRAMIDELQRTIRILKFYTNNDFSFKDVHNEELFYQNGKVVVEVVQLFENYRIVYPAKHQFLGDLFEQLLNKGFKQNEGQFFTPMPITRFIWDSLPLDSIISNAGKYTLPKVIDYACGAGHFLTEAVEAINAALARQKQSDLSKENAWVEKNIFGIEKDYRLARVSKISLFMNGAGYGNIIFGDGLDNYPEKSIESGVFDILVANPPYAVKAFKVHFKPKNNRMELLEKISNDGSEIEVLFIERIAQLLKPTGIAAVILPASILSNSSSSYIAARENLLENFKIHALVQFGSKTFGATGTNTVVMFLEKYAEPPKRKKMVEDSVVAIQSGKNLSDWEDDNILENYLKKIEVSRTDYESMLRKDMPIAHWSEHNYFGQFVKAFSALTEVKNKQKQQSFKRLPEAERNKWLSDRFHQFVLNIEADKLKFFALIYRQNTLVVTSPTDNDEQKEFLGYDWSNRKGAEGIQIQTPGGKLYNDNDRVADTTIAAAVRQAFARQYNSNDALKKYLAWYRLQDMIDFSRVGFNKEIKPSVANLVEIISRWGLTTLEDIVPVIESGSRPVGGVNGVTGGAISVGGEHIGDRSGYLDLSSPKYVPSQYYNSAKRGKIKKHDILLCKDGALTGKVAIVRDELDHTDAMCNEHVFILRCENLILQKYVFCFLFSSTGQALLKSNITGADQGGLNLPSLKNIKIPLPPPEIQQRIVEECEKFDAQCSSHKKEIKNCFEDISKVFQEAQSIASINYRLRDRSLFEIIIGKRVLNSELIPNAQIPVYSANVHEPFGYMDKSCITDFSRSSVLWGIDGDWMTDYIPENIAFNPTDHCGVIRVLSPSISAKYLSFALYEAGKRARFSRTLRASIDRIEGLTVVLPGIDMQRTAVAEIEKLEQKISALQQLLDSAAEKKQAILDKYLR